MSATGSPTVTGQLVLTGGTPDVWHNRDKMTVSIDLSAALGFPSAAFVICRAPNGQPVLADVVSVPQALATVSDTFVLGNPFFPWASGTYTVSVYVNVVNGPAPPLALETTFQYEA